MGYDYHRALKRFRRLDPSAELTFDESGRGFIKYNPKIIDYDTAFTLCDLRKNTSEENKVTIGKFWCSCRVDGIEPCRKCGGA